MMRRAIGGAGLADVFLSYAHEDEGRARELAQALEGQGLTVFWDRKVPAGETWDHYIGSALERAKCVVVAWSGHAVQSPYVREEAGEGKDRRALVPVFFEKIKPPFGFRQIHAANLTEWRAGQSSPDFDGLVNDIRGVVGRSSTGGAEQVEREDIARQPSPEAPRTSPPQPAARSSRPWILGGLLVIVAAGGFGAYQLLAPRGEAPQPNPSMAEPATPPAEPSEVEPAAPPVVATAAPEPGDEMRDCVECPEMVLVPAGEFVMGSPDDELGRDGDEGPQRTVTIGAPFWVGKYEVTRAEFAAFVDASGVEASGGCRVYTGGEWKQDAGKSWRDPGFEQSDRHPVTCVSWEDAEAYVRWLSGETGKDYRLLSEAEWEYAARAKAGTARFWGNDADQACSFANVHDDTSQRVNGFSWEKHDCDDGFARTAPVGSFDANDFGLNDMLGNVWEWVEDCWNGSYDDAPTDGSAWLQGDCSLRVLRGGSWVNEPGLVRSASRIRYIPDSRVNYSGFRVARTPD